MSEDTRETIQRLAAQLQNIMQQVQTVETQIREIETTIGALQSQDPNRPVYRQVGPLLLEVDDRKSLKEELEQSRSTLDEHLGRIQGTEKELRSAYESAVKAFEAQ